MDLDKAASVHLEWKLKLRGAINKQETMDVATISKDNCCDLGKWLHGEGKTQFGRLATHTECLQKHATFHVEAGKVASVINAKKFPEAEAMLGSGTAFAQASSGVGVAIIKLKKEANI